MSEDFVLGGKKCHVYTVGDGGPCIIWGTMNFGSEPFPAMVDVLSKSEDEVDPFTLFCFEVSDWNNEFSPWAFDAGKDQKFGDGGRATLQWIKDNAIPYVEENYPHTSEFAITGYSLAGLFALWAFYESGDFKGAGCCSGSLWFDGWDKYADGSKVPDNGAVYLSLGGKEPGSGNLLTASIGVQYLKQKKRLEKDSSMRAFVYQMNSGGHFADPVGRVAKSILWLVHELSVY